jgi:hypothetical protein
VTTAPAKPLPRVERDSDDNHPVFFHACTGLHAGWEDIGGKLPLGADGWQWRPDGSLTPSIRCLECGTHGFWDGPAKGWREV